MLCKIRILYFKNCNGNLGEFDKLQFLWYGRCGGGNLDEDFSPQMQHLSERLGVAYWALDYGHWATGIGPRRAYLTTRSSRYKMEFCFLNLWIIPRYCLFAAGISGEV
ncbi:hypothetical protein IQ269_09930 [Tychonema sp. LEGE 07199]|uniref:hypothetical protein n=1 Tax=unclassified Tychonema TaxID=2642144 RepID=UPI0018806BDD|nr:MULTISPECIES: hypothetical protein [unclassified Tychonema]MBE9121129.1 hypothetical protein [Tychonema sp. LEGE 07199]MBE9132277.1 hypothetical protein [Tychonema sp. LEGE 07196]